MTREAELKARDFVALVAGGFGAETEVGVVQRLLLQAQTAVASYADAQWAAERGWPMLVDALLFRLDTAPAGLGRPAGGGQRADRRVLHDAGAGRHARLAATTSTCRTG